MFFYLLLRIRCTVFLINDNLYVIFIDFWFMVEYNKYLEISNYLLKLRKWEIIWCTFWEMCIFSHSELGFQSCTCFEEKVVRIGVWVNDIWFLKDSLEQGCFCILQSVFSSHQVTWPSAMFLIWKKKKNSNYSNVKWKSSYKPNLLTLLEYMCMQSTCLMCLRGSLRGC